MKTAVLIATILIASWLPLPADRNPGEYPDLNTAPLGEDETARLNWKRTTDGLEIMLPPNQPCEHAFAFRVH